MALDYFDSRMLVGVITKRPPQYSLFSQLFFSPRSPLPTDKMELHIKTRGNQLLPFVREEEPGRLISGGEGEVVVVRVPRIRVKRQYRATEVLKNPLGYNPYELVSDPVERAIVEDLDELRRRIDMTIEWMCAKIATSGKFSVSDTIDGASKVIYEIDNRMPAAHKITLSGTSLWSNEKSTIMENVEDWATRILDETGNAPTDLVLGRNVWGKFFRHADVQKNLDNRRIDMGGLTPRAAQMFKGLWNGLRVWVYAGSVTNHTGQAEYLLNADSVVLGAKDEESTIEYGLPLDRKCAGATAYFVKTYDEEDPSATWVLAESRPLPWAKRPGCFVCAKVL